MMHKVHKKNILFQYNNSNNNDDIIIFGIWFLVKNILYNSYNFIGEITIKVDSMKRREPYKSQ